jgi:hypothetical protein
MYFMRIVVTLPTFNEYEFARTFWLDTIISCHYVPGTGSSEALYTSLYITAMLGNMILAIY